MTGKKAVQLARKSPVVTCVIILAIVMAVGIPDFRTVDNLLNLAKQMSPYGIAAVGLVFVLIGGQNDLSIGASIMLCGVSAAGAMTALAPSLGAFGGIIAGLLTGALIGLLNGVVVAVIGINCFIATISMEMLINGLGLVLTNAQTIGNLPDSFRLIGTAEPVGLPLPILIMFVFYAAGQFTLKKTAFGRNLYSSGANMEAARLVGINVVGMQVITYIISGVCAASAGMIIVARLGAATPSAGAYTMLDTLSAVIIGGASLFGGRGSVVGAAIGVLLLQLIQNGFNLLGVDFYTTMVVKGLIILVAVMIDAMNGRNLFAGVRKRRSKQINVP